MIPASNLYEICAPSLEYSSTFVYVEIQQPENHIPNIQKLLKMTMKREKRELYSFHCICIGIFNVIRKGF